MEEMVCTIYFYCKNTRDVVNMYRRRYSSKEVPECLYLRRQEFRLCTSNVIL